MITEKDIQYLTLLAKQYPTIDVAVTEIINLRAILGLSKGTEHFVSDLHGEYESFTHVLRTASGVIRRKIEDLFQKALSESDKRSLATLIYYPDQKLDEFARAGVRDESWYVDTLHKLVRVCRFVTSKYTRSKVRKAFPKEFGYIIEELLHEDEYALNKQNYYNEIIHSIMLMEKQDDFMIALCKLIQRMAVDRLHVIGDIFDRGPGADIVMDHLMQHHSIDVQWGNHDILWMGAAAGSQVCVATAMRISLRYANIDMLREGYGIDISPLATLAHEVYADDPCELFFPNTQDDKISQRESHLIARMHKAIAIIEAKLTAQLVRRRPEFEMLDRTILDGIDLQAGTVRLDGKVYPLKDRHFPTLLPNDPFALTPDEESVIRKLTSAFTFCDKLQNHVKFLFAKGSIYLCYNGNLIYHGCIPMNPDGSFRVLRINEQEYSGRSLMDWFERTARNGYFSKDPSKRRFGMDIMWYLWAGRDSPLFGKSRMTTFERSFIEDKATHYEEKNPYYQFRDDAVICGAILREFGFDPSVSHIINGHVPVKVKKGENPVKANGRLLVIDGGFAKAYQKETGIAGYTLIYNSKGLSLTAHQPFESTEKAIREELDVRPEVFLIEKSPEGIRIRDTDIGREIQLQIIDLMMLIEAYKTGSLRSNGGTHC